MQQTKEELALDQINRFGIEVLNKYQTKEGFFDCFINKEVYEKYSEIYDSVKINKIDGGTSQRLLDALASQGVGQLDDFKDNDENFDENKFNIMVDIIKRYTNADDSENNKIIFDELKSAIRNNIDNTSGNTLDNILNERITKLYSTTGQNKTEFILYLKDIFKDVRKCFDYKKFFKNLNGKIYYKTENAPISSIVQNGIQPSSNNTKLFFGGSVNSVYDIWETNKTIITYIKNGIINYQYLKYKFLEANPEYRNKKRMEDDVKNNKDAMAKYIKWIYEKYPFPQMKKFIGSTASLFNYSTATPEEPTDSKDLDLLSFYLLKDFFKRNNNEYIIKDLYEKSEYKPLTNKKVIPLRLLHGSVKPDIHFDKMIADRYTNSSKSFTPNDLSNLLGMMNFQSKLKNQVGGGQYGGYHLYKHIFENLQNKLAGYKIKINHADEEQIEKNIDALKENERKIVDSLDTIKKFTYSKNIADYKGYEVSVDDMYNEIIKTRKDSADKEDKLMGFITKLNKWIKEHFNE